MLTKKTFLSILFYATVSAAFGYKQSDTLSPLRVGDKVPEIVFENVLNFPAGKTKLSDFRGKMVILDFWNLHCSGCIRGFPKMQRIQEAFKDKVQVLLVNSLNTADYLQKHGFPNKTPSPIISNTTLPFVLLATELGRLFPHHGEPHHVWIDQNGVVKVITTEQGTTMQSVSDFLAGKEVKLPDHMPVEQMGLIIDNSSFLKPQNKWVLDNILYSSTITRYLQGGGFDKDLYDTVNRKIYGRRRHGDLLALFKMASPVEVGSRRDLIKIEGDRLFKYFPPSNANDLAKWMLDYYYTYEIRLPEHLLYETREENVELLNKKMWKELEEFFGLDCFFEKRKVRCWILTSSAKKATKSLATKGGTTFNEYSDNGLTLVNNSFNWLLIALREKNGYPEIFLNETGFGDGAFVDIQLNTPLTVDKNLPRIKRELNEYGLDLVQAERIVELMVFKDVETPRHKKD